jgi:hypothetical protein
VPKVQFFGKVLPEPIKVSVQGPKLTWKWQEENLDLVFRVKIDNSIVEVECGIAKYEPSYLVELHKRASDLARASANLAAFAAGQGLIVTLDRFIDPGGTALHIIFSDPSLPPLCTAFGLEPARQADFDVVSCRLSRAIPLHRTQRSDCGDYHPALRSCQLWTGYRQHPAYDFPHIRPFCCMASHAASVERF